jgi:hypothetical protein
VIHPGGQPIYIAGHHVQLDLVKATCAGRCAKIDFSAWIFAVPRNSRREVEDTREILEIRSYSTA